jgi:protein TonB
MSQYLGKNVKYPVRAEENGISGVPVVQFTVETDGTLTDFLVVKSVDPDLDAEALRVAKSMPKWIPAKDKDGNAKKATSAIYVSFGIH